MASPTKRKLDIFQVLGFINEKKPQFYRNLSEEEQKAVQPLVLMRWLTGTKSAQQIYFLNELVNPFVFSMYKHKELLTGLMTICTSGRPTRNYWNKAKGKGTTTMPKAVAVVREHLGYCTRDALSALPLLSDEDILNYASDLARQPDEMKVIKKELRSRKKK